jgi:outer membrane protein TolC
MKTQRKSVQTRRRTANRIDPEITTETLSDNRKDLQAMAKSTAAYQKMLQSAKMNFLPRLNAFGSYELYDRNLFGTAAKGYLVGAQLSWSLFDGYQSIGKAGKAKAEFLKSSLETQQYKAQSQLEWNKTNRQLKDAENKVALSQRAFEQSQEAYRIRQNRFAQGLEKPPTCSHPKSR